MRGRKLHLSVIVIMATVAVAGFAYVGLNKTLHWLLQEDAKSIGMNWAHHMDTHLPDFLDRTGPNGLPRSRKEPDPDDLAMFAFDILSVKNIHQIDFINTAGECVSSFGSFLTPMPSPAAQAHSQINDPLKHQEHSAARATATTQTPGSARQDGSVHETVHAVAPSELGSEWRLPIDHRKIGPILGSGLNEIIVRWDSPPHQPDIFAEVYHPIKSAGQTVYLLRVLVDLEDRAALYRNLLITGTLILLALAALFFMIPTRKFLQIRRGKHEADEKAHFLATHDLMTGLANRNAFQDNASRLLGDCRSNQEECVLILIDIDGFKDINDFYGHDAGDQLLKQVAGALMSSFPDDSLIARIGGDEFAVMVRSSAIKAGSVAEYLDIPVSFEINLNQRIQNLEVSIAAGMVKFPRDGTHLQELMLNADLAWYSAKKSSVRRFCEFDASLRQQFQTRINLLQDFSRALDMGQIIPHYQPLVCAITGRVDGFEALARWQHPTRGLLTPAFFHEALEDRQIAQALGTHMLGAITTDMAAWKAQGLPFETVGLNVTDADLLRPGFSLDVIAELSRHGLSGRELAIEITENCLFGGEKAVMAAKLEELRSAGCHVALDDFGTGYSSITHIKDMPVTAVKIDKSFIRAIAKDSADQAIVRALVDLGGSIGFKLVAEGVETDQQRRVVQTLGCHLIQGFYYAKPVPANEVPDLVANLNRSATRMAG